jgi:lysyl-tRNA synthetase class 1
VRAKLQAEKRAPLMTREAEILEERIAAARRWLEDYAPERARLTVQRDALPLAVAELDPSQRAMLTSLAAALETAAWDGEAIQAAIFDAARAANQAPGRAFAALYAAFLGQSSGPRAGWLLASLERDFVLERLRAAAAPDTLST